MNNNQEPIMIEKSAIVVMFILGACMYTFTMTVIAKVEWNIFLVAISSLPIVSIPYLHSRLEQRRQQFDAEMQIGLREFEKRLRGK